MKQKRPSLRPQKELFDDRNSASPAEQHVIRRKKVVNVSPQSFRFAALPEEVGSHHDAGATAEKRMQTNKRSLDASTFGTGFFSLGAAILTAVVVCGLFHVGSAGEIYSNLALKICHLLVCLLTQSYLSHLTFENITS
jgi:hypothetical protein